MGKMRWAESIESMQTAYFLGIWSSWIGVEGSVVTASRPAVGVVLKALASLHIARFVFFE